MSTIKYIEGKHDTSDLLPKKLDQNKEVVMDFSRAGKPTDNAIIESFNGSYRDDC